MTRLSSDSCLRCRRAEEAQLQVVPRVWTLRLTVILSEHIYEQMVRSLQRFKLTNFSLWHRAERTRESLGGYVYGFPIHLRIFRQLSSSCIRCARRCKALWLNHNLGHGGPGYFTSTACVSRLTARVSTGAGTVGFGMERS